MPAALLLSWAAPYAAITGLLYTRYLRYSLPLAPVLCIAAVWLAGRLARRRLRIPAYLGLLAASLVLAVVFGQIYSPAHTWVRSSEWIYERVPSGARIAVEDWDIALPLPLEINGKARRIEEYDVRTLTIYDEPDDAAKWHTLAEILASSDYVIVASRRVYGSVPRQPDRYPVATRYYEMLFAGELGFEVASEMVRGPGYLNPRLPPLPDAAPGIVHPDESFVVYDHPRVIILRNSERLPSGEVLRRLGVEWYAAAAGAVSA
jgi:hypothetical protein